MFKTSLLVLCAVVVAQAQVPSLGWCPEYIRMPNFDMSKFLGTWYESQRYFQISELVSRCAMANYTLGPDNKFRVSNEVLNRFTGIKRVVEGVIRHSQSKAEEGKLFVKYETLPLDPETSYSVLETDYKNFAVLWSCNSIGPLSAQNAWIMTRQRIPSDNVLQKAYGVLDKYKISKTFFVKADQTDCEIAVPDKPVVAEEEEAPVEENQNLRSIISDIPKPPNAQITEVNDQPIQANAATEVKEEQPAPVTVPEVILKTAEIAKEPTEAKLTEPVLEIQPAVIAEEPNQLVPEPAKEETLKTEEKKA